MAGIYPVVLCGGAGTRLWPTSRPWRPKQFAAQLGERSTFQETLLRVGRLAGRGETVIVAGAAHRGAIAEQLAAVDVTATLLLEPESRNSAAAIAAACHWIRSQDPDGVAVIVATDHHVPDDAAFAETVAAAVAGAGQGEIVTFGVRPTAPSSAYGYIRPGARLGDAGLRRVMSFVEKPDEGAARAYIAKGYLWNSGNFVASAALLLDQLALHAPDIARATEEAVAQARSVDGALLLGDAFRRARDISFDHAVLESSDRVAVLPVAHQWSDLGAWDAVFRASEKGENGNAVSGSAALVDTHDSLVRVNSRQRVAVVGVRGLAVVVERDAVLVCDLAASQSVREVAGRVLSAATPEARATVAKRLAAVSGRLDLWRRAGALPLWSTVGLAPTGPRFQEAIALDGRPVDAPRRLRVQARQVFVYAEAGLSGWEGPWREVVDSGIAGIFHHYRREDGSFRPLAATDGGPDDGAACLYDHAFVLFALAWAARVRPGAADESAALALVAGSLQAARHAAGGFREADGDFPFQSNPHMHLLEAALAWEDTSAEGVWRDLADEIAVLALSRLIDPASGAVREFFDLDWAPAAGVAGREIWPGHQFEWAWLLERWALRRKDARAVEAATRLYHQGCAGVDSARGVAVDALLDDGSVLRASARLWPQTERLKAALLLSRRGDAARDDYLADALAAAESLETYLETPAAGLWRDSLRPDGGFVEGPAPASSLYHIVGALAELRAATGGRGQP